MPKAAASFIRNFFKMESSAGILLFLSAVLAMIIANSGLAGYYNLLLDTPVAIQIGALDINKPLLLWINDGLMAVFFFLVGLELKRELIDGELSDKKNIVLPGLGAIGGMLFPALVFFWFNKDDPQALQGWAIPAATDIAFALAVLKLLGPRVPVSLKIFLTSLAIFDDIGAILVIAFFYTSQISTTALWVVAACVPVLYAINKKGVEATSTYILIGVIMWVAMLKSGVHATLTGVILAMFIPMKSKENPEYSPLKSLEHNLHSAVAYIILPIFAFANSGLNLSGVGLEQMLHPVPLGIALGLVVGKQVGIFSLCWIAIKLGWAAMPDRSNWVAIYGVSALCGIGFTMSLFIGSLAYEETQFDMVFDERLGIIVGSMISATIGFFVLKTQYGKNAAEIESKS
ncbi:Na+/H+ antiporter NhaA [Marinicella sp. S1101]|uniref:Na+/H+ antiporter NhaA n=1 Tax=Marinicella marina TaxID=2996016 RepID=UPI002260F70B|nr:Na+/H+ antiporter NhaA [Marinicella marina]MCX7555050.1 Na+/H+ antiporter NhaA [Marinicella marina]MDJ1141358.1 Na+/H+ antiporter NhaA [Marinicella marina]